MMTWVEAAHEPSGGAGTARIAVECPWWHDAVRQLTAISRLPASWDSHGGDPPEPRLVNAATGLLRLLCAAADLPRPHINPTPSSGVQFEWENAGRYFEIDVIGDANAAWFCQDRSGGAEAEGELAVGESLQEVVECIRRATGTDEALG